MLRGPVGEKDFKLFDPWSEVNVAFDTTIIGNSGLEHQKYIQSRQYNRELDQDADSDMIMV